MKLVTLTARLLASEGRREAGAAGAGCVPFRVFEKLRPSLSTLAGAAGYQSLVVRALALARARASWLAEVSVAADGGLSFPAEIESLLDAREIERGGGILVEELLGLLCTLIGEPLTVRLLRNVWPDVEALSESPKDPS
jgi:hypothetical protein